MLMCKQHVLFLQAFTGSYATSAFYNKGKNRFQTLEDSQDAAEVYKIKNQRTEDIFTAGVKCILAL